MNKTRQDTIARRTALGAGTIVVGCVLLLTWSYIVTTVQRPGEDQRIAELQEQVQADASLAPELAAEHERITEARSARKARNDVIAIILIVASAGFIAAMKWRIALRGRQPAPMSKLVQVAASPPVARPSHRTPTADGLDLSFVEQTIERLGHDREAAILILQAIQSHYRYLPDEALRRVCELTTITPAQIAGTSSFYAQFRRSPVGKHVIRVCHGTACHVSGARQITEELRRYLVIPEGEDTDPDRMFTVDEVACLGCCSLAPVLMVDDHTAGRLTPASACRALDQVEQKEPA